MAHIAKIENGTVVTVICVRDVDVATWEKMPGCRWVQTSYNTAGGIHYGDGGNPDGGVGLRANFASVGGVYDEENDVFYTQRPYPSWLISSPDWLWKPPVPYPSDGCMYEWDEASLSWVAVVHGN